MKIRVALIGALAAATAALGVGCTPPANEWEAERQAVWLGNGIFFIIYIGLCQANNGVCPFPIAPTLPVPAATPAPSPEG